MIIIKKFIAVLLVAILFFNNIKISYANPVVPAVVAGGIGISALAGGTAAALEGIQGFENAQTTWDIANTVWNTADAMKKQAIENAVITAVETGAKTVSFTQDVMDWWNENFVNNAIEQVVPELSPTDIALGELGYLLNVIKPNERVIYNVITLPQGMYVTYNFQQYRYIYYMYAYENVSTGKLLNAHYGLMSSATNTNSRTGGVVLDPPQVINSIGAILALFASSAFEFNNDLPTFNVDNWAEEVERVLANALSGATTAGLNIALGDVVATTLTGDMVKWNPKSRTWEDAKGVPLNPDIPVENVRVKPKAEEGTENPPIEGNPPIVYPGLQVDFSVPETAALNFQPLVGALSEVTTKFPFSIPWDLKKQLSLFNVQPQAPKIDIDFSKFPYAKAGTKWTIDLSFMNPLAAAARWALTIAIDIAFILMLRRLLPE
ncbi:hypothetical protein [Schinkia azotoformans]|uniref:hypothetical protein n=1 Tax=Schinkia azotoformans TaxID=1454 RepID=UPI003D2BC857